MNAPTEREKSTDAGLRLPDRSQIGRYRLAYELASGGMATVYMACVEAPGGFDKIVALKRIHRHLAKEDRYVEMFLDEARIASRIDHPNVATVIDFGEDEGEYFMVMEFLVGVPLSRMVGALARSEDMPVEGWPAIASRLVAEACEGLHAAHELRDARGELRGVVHRDVSPQNLFVGFDGILRVVDFGIAKATGKLHKTATGELKGKVAYMAPEQLRGTGVDRRADVWALGVVLWEMVTLKRLFRGDNEVDTMYSVLERDVPSVRTLVENVPAALDELIASTLVRDLETRCAETRDLARGINKIWAREPGDPVDASVVSDLLKTLFPGEEERQRNLVELARYPRDEIPQVTVNPEEDSFSGIRDQPNAIDARQAPTETAMTTLEGPAPSASRPTAARRGVLAVIALLAVSLGAAGVLFQMQPATVESGPAPETETEPEPEPERPPEPTPEPQAVPEPEPPPEPEPARPTSRRRRRAPLLDPGRTSATTEPTDTAPPDTAAPARVEPGRVAVVVPGGWANVYEGRTLLGSTPLNHELSAGQHRLELRFYGEPPPVPVVVDVPAGGVVRLSRRAPSR